MWCICMCRKGWGLTVAELHGTVGTVRLWGLASVLQVF